MTHKIGCIQYATNQGIAMLAKQFFEAGIITDIMVFRHGSYQTHLEWYPAGTIELVGRPFNGPKVEAFIKSVDVMLFFETPFDWSVLELCRKLGTKTVIVPMYECTPKVLPFRPDKFICPSLLDVEYFPGSEFIPIPVPSSIKWEQRTVAKKFLHNGGHLGLRGHKGTLELLQAMKHVKSDLTLHVRAQDAPGLKKLIQQTPEILQDERVTFEYGDIPYENLFKGYDVLVAPEKYNGLSLPLQEAFASGMLVVTSNRFPHNTWLPNWCLIPVENYSRQSVGGSYNEYDEALIKPEVIANTMDYICDQNIVIDSLEGREYSKYYSFETLKDRWIGALLS